MNLKHLFKKTMKNITFLTESELKDLRTLRNENINDEELQPFVSFLKKNSENFSLNGRKNRMSVHQIAKAFFLGHVAYKSGYEGYTEKVRTFKYDNQIDALIGDILPQISPEIASHQLYASTLTTEYLQIQIQDYLWRHLDTAIDFDFDYVNFIADPNFDLSIYSIDYLESDLKNNTIAIHEAFEGVFNAIYKPVKCEGETTEYNAYNLFIESVTKSLTEEQKTLIQDNFLGNFKFYLDNAKPDLVKSKDDGFRKSIKHIYLKNRRK